MPHEKIKKENYSSFGGRNRKASIYLTGPNEVLESFNLTGEIVGDLTGRPGSTQYYSATFANTGILGLAEYTKLNGFSKIMVANPGGMWLGQDNSVAGVSLGGLASTQTVINDAATTQIQVRGATFGDRRYDYAPFVDHMFFCDGRIFLKYNGSSFTLFSLPRVSQNSDTLGETGNVTALGFTPGYYSYKLAYMNDRGFIGNADFIRSFIVGVSQTVVWAPTFPYTNFGITAIVMYRSFGASAFSENYFEQTVMPLGSTNYIDESGSNGGDIPNNYIQPWVGFSNRSNLILGSGTVYYYNYMENVPRFLEVYKNQLMCGGFSNQPSTVWFSDVAEPEGFEADFNFEVKTNDGDRVTALKVYANRLVVGKELSLHELTGDNPENFILREVSSDYGILNNRACCTWKGRFWFLDRRGIAEYVGSIPELVSQKVEDIFQRMNLSAARDQAQMIYMKNRNEVWCLIPIDGSEVNNIIVVFDIDGGGWYFWDGPNISVLAKMIGRFGKETSFYGDYSGRVNSFGSSFFGDNGSGFTSLVQFRYEHEMGESVEKMYRRLFVNADSMAGNATLAINTNLRANYGSSSQVSGTMVLSSFQDVQDFGIPAKSLSVEISHFSAVDSMKLHGYALESRWLRNT